MFSCGQIIIFILHERLRDDCLKVWWNSDEDHIHKSMLSVSRGQKIGFKAYAGGRMWVCAACADVCGRVWACAGMCGRVRASAGV